jgi:hypothetical protein
MAKAKEEAVERVVKMCGTCGATVFEGPFTQGEIVNGDLVPRRAIFRCVNCNRVQDVSEMVDHVIAPYVM